MKTETRGILDLVTMEIEAGTNTPMGGDSGHGGQTILFIRTDGPDFEIHLDKGRVQWCKELQLITRGDAEGRALAKALRLAAGVLEQQIEHNATLLDKEVQNKR